MCLKLKKGLLRVCLVGLLCFILKTASIEKRLAGLLWKSQSWRGEEPCQTDPKIAQPILSILLPAPSILFFKKTNKEKGILSARTSYPYPFVSPSSRTHPLRSVAAKRQLRPSPLPPASIPSFSNAASLLPSTACACARLHLKLLPHR